MHRLFVAGASAAALLVALPAASAAPPPAVAPAPVRAAADWKQIPAENLMVIDTTKGRVVVELRPEVAPEHVERIKTLTRQNFYDGLQFFRVIDDFMAQTGDRENTGAGQGILPPLRGTFTFRRGPEAGFVTLGRNLDGETIGYIGSLPVHTQPDDLALMTADSKVRAYGVFCPGTAGMARTADPNSASGQFFLMRGRTESLDQQYTPWGRVVVGQDVVNRINAGEPPPQPDSMTRVRIAADLPAAERPNLWRIDPSSASFKAEVAAAQARLGSSYSVCDVSPAVQAR